MECKCDCLLSINGKCTKQSKKDMTELEKWKNDFKEFIDELSIPKDDYDGIMEYIDEVPKEKTGKWIIIDDCEKFIAKCSECGRIEDSRMISKYPYCHCGCHMIEPQGK